jgi:hypothetical protein
MNSYSSDLSSMFVGGGTPRKKIGIAIAIAVVLVLIVVGGVIAYKVKKSRDSPDNFVVLTSSDSSGAVLKTMAGATNAELAAECIKTVGCGGFNSSGQLKSAQANLVSKAGSTFYAYQPPGYKVAVGKDAPYKDVAQVTVGGISDFAAACSARADCKAFNDDGWLKNTATGLVDTPHHTFYTKE